MSAFSDATTSIIEDAPRLDKIANEPGTYVTRSGAVKETVQGFLARKDTEFDTAKDALVLEKGDEIDAALLPIEEEATEQAAIATTAAGTATTQAGIATTQASTATTQAGIAAAAAADINSRIRTIDETEEPANGGDTPVSGFVDPVTGLYLLWIDVDGRVYTGAGEAGAGEAGAGTGDGGGDSSGLIAENDALGAALAMLTDTYADVFRIDSDGTWRAPKLVDGFDHGVLMVESIGTRLRIYQRADDRESADYLMWEWLRVTNSTGDFWRWAATSRVRRLGNSWQFLSLLNWIGAGEQDIVLQEANDDDGKSIDFPAETVNGFSGLGHGNEYLTRPLAVWIDGQVFDPATRFRCFARHVRLNHQSRILRARSPAADPLTATVWTLVDKNWEIDSTGLRARHRCTFEGQYTGFAYFPLLTVRAVDGVTPVTDRLLRDDAYRLLALPADIVDAGGAEPDERNGVRRLVYSGPNGGVSVEVGEPQRWPDGFLRRRDSQLQADLDLHRIKVPPLDTDHKTYFHFGGTELVLGGDTYYRAVDGEVWERDFSVRIHLH